MINWARDLTCDSLFVPDGRGKDGAAAELNVKPTTLYGKMQKHKIKGSRQHKAM